MRWLFWVLLTVLSFSPTTGCDDDPPPDADGDGDGDGDGDADADGDADGDGDADADADGVPIVDSGLEERPINRGCLALERPVSARVQVELTNIYPELEEFARVPIWMTRAPGDSSRWFVAEQPGRVLSFDDAASTRAPAVVLDISARVESGPPEAGLLGLAFHPSFAANGEVFLSYTTRIGGDLHSRISRFFSADGGETIDEASEEVMIEFRQIDEFHNGGQILFGPDGMLYIGFGDGGDFTNPASNPQDPHNFFGAILRIDVDGDAPYGIPADNPFADGVDGAPEVFAYGFRNPWRFSFDAVTGELFVGDVGDASFEEVSLVVAGGNYGWPILEGSSCLEGPGCDTSGLILPIIEYGHDVGAAVIGGHVYRGAAIPALEGAYIYGDNVSGRIWAAFYDEGSGEWVPEVLLDTGLSISSFAVDLAGEIYVVDHSGTLTRLTPSTEPPPDFPQLLSETGCVDPDDPWLPAPGLIHYDVRSPLWSDGAIKDRWLALPEGETIGVLDDGDLDLPVGTVLVKSFRLGDRRLETRLLMRHPDGGWAGYTYRWNEAQTEAELLEGELREEVGGQTWTYPSRAGCLRCHTTAAGRALGPEVAQLNSLETYPGPVRANQLSTFDHIGLFTDGLPAPAAELPALADPGGDAPAAERARSSLHANCSFCHRPEGPGRGELDLRFEVPLANMGVCDVEPSHGDLGLADARVVAPGEPDRSVLPARMGDTTTWRMPPLATAVVDTEGLAAIEAWISALDDCP